MQKKDIPKFLIVLAVALLAVLLVYYFVSLEEPPLLPEVVEEEIIPPPATGNIDDAVSALLKEIVDIEGVLMEEEIDVDLVASDIKEINDFGQSINENEL